MGKAFLSLINDLKKNYGNIKTVIRFNKKQR